MRSTRSFWRIDQILICFIALCAFAKAQAQITWRRSYGGNGSDAAFSVKQTLDGGYIVAGAAGSFGVGGDGYLLKLDEFGEVQWSGYYGDAQVDEFRDVEVLSDGYLVVGISSSPSNGGYDGLLLRLDVSGTVLWRRNYGSAEWDFLYSVAIDPEGYFLSGTTYADASSGAECWVIRTNLDGEVIWDATFGGPYEDEARAVHSSADGGCVFAGSMGEADGGSDVYVGKLYADGSLEWDLSWGTDSLDKASSLDIMQDGNIIVGGSTRSFMSYQQLLLAKVDPTGVLSWSNHIGQISDWEGYDVRVRSSGGFAMAAYTTAFGLGGRDMYLLLTDSEGQYEFGTTFGGSEDDEAQALDLTDDGSFVLAGSTGSFGPGIKAVFVVKTGTNGLTEFQGVEDYFDPVTVPELPVALDNTLLSSIIHPNEPLRFNKAFVSDARLTVADNGGRIVDLGIVQRGSSFIALPALASGLYSLSIAQDAARSVHRFVVIQ